MTKSVPCSINTIEMMMFGKMSGGPPGRAEPVHQKIVTLWAGILGSTWAIITEWSFRKMFNDNGHKKLFANDNADYEDFALAA